MLQNLGQTIRNLRKQKGITLNDFAEKLSVSPGYLSNLETQKTDTVSLSLLTKIDEELNLFPSLSQHIDSEHELHFRLDRMCHLLKSLHDEDAQLAEYFITHVEQGLQLLKK